MNVLVAVVAGIIAINVAYAAWLAISELMRGRRARREVGTLREMWQLPEVPRGGRRRPSRVLVGALAVTIVGGAALATPAGNHVVSTVSGVIGDLREDPDDGQLAAADDEASSSPDASTSPEASTSPTPSDDPRDPPRGDRRGPGAASDDPATNPWSPSPVTDPGEGTVPPVDEEPSPTTEPEPEPSSPPVSTFASSAEPVSATEIEVTWDRVPSATRYTVHRSDGEGPPLLVADLSAGKRDVVVSALTPETAYDFTVTALSPDGVVATSSASATTPPAIES